VSTEGTGESNNTVSATDYDDDDDGDDDDAATNGDQCYQQVYSMRMTIRINHFSGSHTGGK
jgi:hypothetical protein